MCSFTSHKDPMKQSTAIKTVNFPILSPFYFTVATILDPRNQRSNMLKIVVILLVVVTVCSAYPAPYWGYRYGGFPYNYWGNWGYPYYNGYNGAVSYGYQDAVMPTGSRMMFYGEFPGSCEDKSDGLYYVDDRSFAYCFSGKKSIQPCAEGSANPPVGYFNNGGYYGVYDFCSVNLVAKGYGYHGAAAPAYGYGDQGAGYQMEPYGSNNGYGKEAEYKPETYGSNKGYGKEAEYKPETYGSNKGYGKEAGYKVDSYGKGYDGYKETSYEEEYKKEAY